jgi:signal transduction histidine kinase/ActR/RegA family two-component response regulator
MPLPPSVQPLDFRGYSFWNIGIIAIAALLIVGATLSWVAYDEYRQAQESEFRLLEAHARNAEVQVAEALGKIEYLLNQVAEERMRRRALPDKDFISTLAQHRKDIPEPGTLLLTDAAGRILSASDSALLGKDISQENYFTAQLARNPVPQLFISRPDQHLLGSTAIIFTLPMVDAGQRFIGIAGLSVGYKFFPGILQAINPDDSASMSVIFNRDGDLVFRREQPERFFGYNIAQVSTVFREHSSAAAQVTRHIGPSAQNGKTRLFLVRDVGQSGLSLILSRQLDEVLAQWRRNVVIYALIFLFTIFVVVALAVLAARRRQLEAARIEALSRIQKIASQVPGMVFQYRIHPDGHSSMPYASDSIRDLYRIGPEAVREDASILRAVVHPDDLDAFLASIQKSAQDLSRWQSEYRVKFEDGTVRWLFGNALPQREADGSVLWHGFITDITERKQMEADIVAAKQRAEEANLAKSKFLAAASHDLRQPIHAQGLFLEVLAHTELSAQQRELLANVCAASDASAAMLNTLLDFSRVEAGVIEPQLQTFRLQPLLNKIEREFEPQADAKGLLYRSRETDLAVYSDPALIELILRNLVSNAIRYTDHGGLLVACRKRGARAILEVWDTGIGIAASQQREVFREFHQLGNPERDRRKGLGLGLAIVQGLARTLGHRLTLSSTPQRGSVFRLALPIAATLPAEPSAVRTGLTQHLNVRVLVIDDDETVRFGMLHLLRGWGCVCDVAESIEEALALARAHAPDLVICDYRLREQRTGIEAIAALRTLLGKDLPALLITGDTGAERLREALDSGVPLLHKPVSTSQLYRGLVSALKHAGRTV